MWLADPYCAACGRLTVFPSGFDLDHIVPLYKGGPDTDENCQVLCNGPDGCHIIKTGQDMGTRVEKAARYPDWLLPAACHLTIVFGPPGSGKTTLVQEQRGDFDIVIDVDAIIAKLSGLPWYQGTAEWMNTALRVRNKMLAALARESRPAWFINTGSTQGHRAWWDRRLMPAKTIVMDTPEQTCIERIQADPRRPDEAKARAVDGVRMWFKAS